MEIPREAFNAILEELETRPLARNEYRTKAGSGRSQAFGLVNKRCVPVDWSRQCWRRPKLFFHLKEFADAYVTIPWTSITVNQDYQCDAHRDKGNEGLSFLVGFGDYQGGELQMMEGDLSGNHCVQHRAIVADFGKTKHRVLPFTGHRYSLVFYKLKTTRMPTEILPGTVVVQEGKYLFKRGDQILTVNDSIPHPKNGKSYHKPLEKEGGNFDVSFE